MSSALTQPSSPRAVGYRLSEQIFPISPVVVLHDQSNQACLVWKGVGDEAIRIMVISLSQAAGDACSYAVTGTAVEDTFETAIEAARADMHSAVSTITEGRPLLHSNHLDALLTKAVSLKDERVDVKEWARKIGREMGSLTD